MCLLRIRGLLGVLLVWLNLPAAYAVGPQPISPALFATNQPAEIVFSWQAGPSQTLIENGGFEAGIGGWMRLLNSPLRTFTSTNAAEGRSYGYLSGMPDRSYREICIAQEFAVPRGDVTARLSWKDFTLSSDFEYPGTYQVRVRSATNLNIHTILHQGDVGRNGTDEYWLPHEMDLTRYLGQRILLEFCLTNYWLSRMNLRLDDVHFDIFPNAPVYELYVGLSNDLNSGTLVKRSSDTSFTVTGLAPGRRYYWQVAQIGGGRRVVSGPHMFITAGRYSEASPFDIAIPTLSDGKLRLSFPTESGQSYRIMRVHPDGFRDWSWASPSVQGNGQTATVDISLPSDEAAYFRVRTE